MGSDRASAVPRRIVLAVLAVLAAAALRAAAGFEAVPTFEAAKVLPAAQVKGPHHTIEARVPLVGLYRQYKITSDYGAFGADGDLLLLIRLKEVDALARLAETSEAEFHRQFNINVLGTILATKEAVKHFGAKGGSIINLSSVASAGIADAVVYSGTKGAVDAITHALAAELGPRKIRVNAIAPGGVETEGTHEAGVIGSEFEKQMIGGTPLGRIGQPDDIAHVAVFLASDDSAWVTGERLTASGGLR